MPVNKELLAQAENELDAFEKWFTKQGATPLARFERAIVKSYIVAKLGGQLEPIIKDTDLGQCRES